MHKLSDVKFARVKINNSREKNDFEVGKVFVVKKLELYSEYGLFGFSAGDKGLFNLFKNDAHLEFGEWEFLDDKLNVIDAQELWNRLQKEEVKEEEIEYESAPFDLEKALAGEPIWTRSGIDVTDFHYFKSQEDYPIYFSIKDQIESAAINGEIFTGDEDENDLLMKVKKKKKVVRHGWIAISKDKREINGNVTAFRTSYIYDSIEDAKECSRFPDINFNYVKITWEEDVSNEEWREIK